jgi:hypothetical protein
MNGEIITDYCEKCISYTQKKVDSEKNTLTCLTCSAQETYMIDESKLEKEMIAT